jgi:putative phosphoesterase
MMRVAALYDIHANLPALEAVLGEIRQAGVNQIVVGGDVVSGPLPRETLTALLEAEIPTQFIRGNADVEILALRTGVDPGEIPERYREAVRWVAQQLSPEYASMLATWPETLQIEIPGSGEVLFCHATPRSITEVFTRLTSEDRLLPVFEGVNAEIVVCGHTHMQFDRRIGRVRVVNAGSVGMPYGEPGAYWLLLGPDVQLRRTHYDLAEAAERIRDTSYHLAHDEARNILNPHSEQEALDAFARLELR